MKNCKPFKKKYKVLIIILLVIVAIFCYFDLYVNPQIVTINQAYIKNKAIDVINVGIDCSVEEGLYKDLIKICYDSNGEISALQVNSDSVNKLNGKLIKEISKVFNNQTELEYSVPLGMFSGITSLASLGPDVKLKIKPIGSINTEYLSKISSLSINQSYHKVYIKITAYVCVLLPNYTQNLEIKNQVLIAENLIIGKIPNTYLNTENLTNALNLIP